MEKKGIYGVFEGFFGDFGLWEHYVDVPYPTVEECEVVSEAGKGG